MEQSQQLDSEQLNVFKMYSLTINKFVRISTQVPEDGILKNTDLPNCNSREIRDIIIGNGIWKIGDKVFYNMRIKTVQFPNTLREVGKEAFRSCYSLENVSLPPSVEKVGVQAFHGLCVISEINIASLREVGIFAFGSAFEYENYPNFIKCGFIKDVEEGNKFPWINCYQRICQMLLPLGDGSNITVTLKYGVGEQINRTDRYLNKYDSWNLEHKGFKGTKPKIIYDWKDCNSNLTLMNLNGELITVQGFFQQPEGQENLQTLVNAQYPEMNDFNWSIIPSWLDESVKQITCLEVLQRIFAGEYNLTIPILWVYDTL